MRLFQRIYSLEISYVEHSEWTRNKCLSKTTIAIKDALSSMSENSKRSRSSRKNDRVINFVQSPTVTTKEQTHKGFHQNGLEKYFICYITHNYLSFGYVCSMLNLLMCIIAIFLFHFVLYTKNKGRKMTCFALNQLITQSTSFFLLNFGNSLKRKIEYLRSRMVFYFIFKHQILIKE